MKCTIIELEYPFDGRRKATLVTTDEAFCQEQSNYLEKTGDVELIEVQKVRDAIDKIMLECCSTSAEYVCNKLKERLGL